jgi:hypothetical protein
MRTSILLAAATATTLVLASVGPAAVAQSMGGPMMSSPPPKAAKPAPRKAATAPRKKTAARGFLPRAAGAKGPGRCGTHMYWKGGKCVDARK